MDIKGFKDTIKWYDKNAGTYAASTYKHKPDEIDSFLSYLKQNAKILDAGCGGGRDSNIFFRKGYKVSGIDISTGLLDVARKNYPDIQFINASFLDLPFQEKTFDGIWAHASLVHLENITDVKKALSEFNRVLKPNGILHVLVKSQDGKLKTTVVSDSLSNHDRFFRYYTLKEMKNLLVKSGFELLKSEKFNEKERDPKGRSEVNWLWFIAKKQLSVEK